MEHVVIDFTYTFTRRQETISFFFYFFFSDVRYWRITTPRSKNLT